MPHLRWLVGLVVVSLFMMVSCTPAGSPVEPTIVGVTQPAATVPAEPTVAATEIPTEAPTEEAPDAPTLDAFVETLQTAVVNQDEATMQSLMADPIAVGGWRSEWQMYQPAQTITQFQSNTVPGPTAVQFTGLSEEQLTDFLGQTPAAMFGPTTTVATALHSTGWGVNGEHEAILFVTEQDGQFAWSAFLYTFGSFAQSAGDPNDMIPAYETTVSYVIAMQDVTMYRGPGETYEKIGGVFDGQTALVTGKSDSGEWWRVICPDDTVGDCWITADPAFTQPVEGESEAGASDLVELPDPTTLALVSDVTVESPNGRWQATATQTEPVVAGDSERLYVSLIATNGETTWEPVAEWRGYGLGYIWPAVYQWSADSRYLYYTNLGSPDGCSVYVNGTDLHRLDVTDGTVVAILAMGLTTNLALSPDESKLAYTSYDGESIVFVVKDLATGMEQSVMPTDPGENDQTAQIFWSADSETAVFTIVHDACLPTQTNSIVAVDVTTMIATLLIEKDERRYLINEWPDPAQGELLLIDADGQTWQLDINTGDLLEQ